ncbi:MAG: aspartate aminotransferase family protein [Rhodobacteraceae bacterium]|nr:aspartate aminotransferase family protein [Paracoccaceae bacterium]MCY4137675.1 aspartate aminotransferase family protein [Paracoccaceae bacterium]
MVPAILPTYARADVDFASGKGSWLFDRDGKRYLDLGAGIAVNCLGHAHPELVSVLKRQAETLWHTSNLYPVANQQALAERLVRKTFADTVFFTNSGTEAMECAVKMARKYFAGDGGIPRNKIVTFEGSFHGRSLGMISAAGGKKLVDGFGPLLPGFVHVPFGDIVAVESAVDHETAAIMVEPVQGESGINPAPKGFLRDLRVLCDRHGILLVLDEIQCGMGRTGKLFAHESEGITPDIMGIAKGIGGGFPLGACLATEKAAAGMVVGTHGSTFGGNPLACAVGMAVMDIVSEIGFLEGVQERAAALRLRLADLVDAHGEVFSGVRGAGLMLGLVCKPVNTDVIAAGVGEGVITIPAGDNVARVLPPLNISLQEIEEGVRRLGLAARSIEARV